MPYAKLTQLEMVGFEKKPLLQWKPHASHLSTTHNDWEAPLGEMRTNPAARGAPGGFANIWYTASDAPLGRLVLGTDDCSHVDGSQMSIRWNDRPRLTDRKTALESWMDQPPPQLNTSVEHWAMRYMDSSGQPFSIDLLVESIAEFSKSGASKQRLLALGALDYSPQMKDGQ